MNDLVDLPLELQYNIYSRLPAVDILKLCQVNSYFSSLCGDADFWRYRAYQDFGVTADKFDKTDLSPSLRYLELLSTIGDKCVPGSERFSPINVCMFRTSRDNNVDDLNYFLNKESKRVKIMYAMRGAVKSDNLELLKYLFSLYDGDKYYFDRYDLRIVFDDAVLKGNIEMVDYLADKIRDISPDRYRLILSNSLYWAAKDKDIAMIERLESLGANNINRILAGAVSGNHLELIDFAIQEGADDFSTALAEAVKSGHLHLIDKFMDLGVTNVDSALTYAVDKDLQTIQYILKKMNTQGINVNRNYLDHLINHLILNNIIIGPENMRLITKISPKNMDIIKYLIALRPTSLKESIDSASGQDVELLQYLITEADRLGILNPQILSSALITSIENNRLDNINYLLSVGADVYPHLAEDIWYEDNNEYLTGLIEEIYPRGFISIDRLDDLIEVALDSNNIDMVIYLHDFINNKTDV